MLRSQAGQSAILVIAGLSLLFGVGVTGYQAAGMELRRMQLEQAATAGANAMAHGLRTGNPAAMPCWLARSGLEHPADYSDAQVCRAVVSNLGQLDYHRTSIRVLGENPDATGQPSTFRVVLTYNDPVNSPLLQLFMGDTFTTVTDGTSR